MCSSRFIHFTFFFIFSFHKNCIYTLCMLSIAFCHTKKDQGAKYLVFSPLIPSKREKNMLVLVLLSLHKYIIVNFFIPKFKSKHTSLKKYTNWEKLTEQKQYIFLSFWGNERRKKNISHLFQHFVVCLRAFRV